MMLHRIGLLPLHINPDNFQKQYLFECKVRHDKSYTFQMVTANDIDIYPLKINLMKRVDDLNDESITDRDPNERENLMAILTKRITQIIMIYDTDYLRVIKIKFFIVT